MTDKWFLPLRSTFNPSTNAPLGCSPLGTIFLGQEVLTPVNIDLGIFMLLEIFHKFKKNRKSTIKNQKFQLLALLFKKTYT